MEVESFTDVDVGVDLITAAVHHVKFLQHVDQVQELV